MSSFSSGFGRGLGWGLGSSMSRDLYRSATAPPRIALSPTAVERVESEVDGTYLLVSVWSTGRTTVHTTLHATAEGEWHLIDDGCVDREHALAAMRQVADYLRRGGTVRGILAMKADLKAAYAAIDTEQAAPIGTGAEKRSQRSCRLSTRRPGAARDDGLAVRRPCSRRPV